MGQEARWSSRGHTASVAAPSPGGDGSSHGLRVAASSNGLPPSGKRKSVEAPTGLKILNAPHFQVHCSVFVLSVGWYGDISGNDGDTSRLGPKYLAQIA